MRRRRRTPLGNIRGVRRWEIGLPLILLGASIAGLTVGVRGGEALFWVGAGLAALGAGVLFGAPRRP